MWVMKSFMYSRTPVNQKPVSVGRAESLSGGRCRVSLLGRDRGDLNSSRSFSRLVNAERPATIASGGRYADCGSKMS